MELLLFLVLILVAYIAFKTMTVLTPVLENFKTIQAKLPRGKKKVQVEILIPKKQFNRPPIVTHKVTAAGLVKSLKVDVLAKFDSLSPNGRYLWGQEFELTATEYRTRGFTPGMLKAKMVQRSVIQGFAECSSEAFASILDELNQNKPLTLRAYGKCVSLDTGDLTLFADSFHYLTEEEASGPKYFFEQYNDFLKKNDNEDTEPLRSFARRFEPRPE